jgi:hypothetical protein
MLRIVQNIPSPLAEKVHLWLAQLGEEKLLEVEQQTQAEQLRDFYIRQLERGIDLAVIRYTLRKNGKTALRHKKRKTSGRPHSITMTPPLTAEAEAAFYALEEERGVYHEFGTNMGYYIDHGFDFPPSKREGKRPNNRSSGWNGIFAFTFSASLAGGYGFAMADSVLGIGAATLGKCLRCSVRGEQPARTGSAPILLQKGLSACAASQGLVFSSPVHGTGCGALPPGRVHSPRLAAFPLYTVPRKRCGWAQRVRLEQKGSN